MSPKLDLIETLKEFLESKQGYIKEEEADNEYAITCKFKESRHISINILSEVILILGIDGNFLPIRLDKTPNVMILADATKLGDILYQVFIDISHEKITINSFSGFYDTITIVLKKDSENKFKSFIIKLGGIL